VHRRQLVEAGELEKAPDLAVGDDDPEVSPGGRRLAPGGGKGRYTRTVAKDRARHIRDHKADPAPDHGRERVQHELGIRQVNLGGQHDDFEVAGRLAWPEVIRHRTPLVQKRCRAAL
jgi:hypothetical protein